MKLTSLKHPRQEPRYPWRNHGLAAVEFLITLPVLLLIMLVTAELGWAFVQYDALSYSVRNSARFVSEHAFAGTTGVVSISSDIARVAKYLAVFGNASGTGEPVLHNCSIGNVEVVSVGGDNVEVRAACPHTPLVGGILPMDVTLRVVVTMRAIS